MRYSDMFLIQNKFSKLASELDIKRFINYESINVFDTLKGSNTKNEVYISCPEEVNEGTISIGDTFAGRDKYLWLRKNIDIPEAKENCQIIGMFDFGITGDGNNSGFESLLYINKEPYQGVDTNHNDVVLDQVADEKVELTFLLWTGLEGGGEPRDIVHTIKRADIGYLHIPTDALYYYTKVILECLEFIPETDLNRHELIKILDKSLYMIEWDTDNFYTSVNNALSYLEKEIDNKKDVSDIIVNVVGHTHIDVAWLWRIKHTREKAMRSFSTVIRLMDEFPEYKFLQTQPQIYRFLKDDSPLLYGKIKDLVSQGKWEVDGGMWVEADCNIPSGESLVRQLKYGINFIKDEFGKQCKYLWLPDVFGYSWALPQILIKCGLETFMTTKISWNQYNSIPNDLFVWRGIDGSEILTYFISTPDPSFEIDSRFSTYNGRMDPRTVFGSWKRFKNKDISNETLVSYGFGDGGGGVNRDMLKKRAVMDKLPSVPSVQTTTAGEFFDKIHQKVRESQEHTPVWDGELYLEYHRGTYTSQASHKKMNRKIEFDLLKSEWLASYLFLSGKRYPDTELDKAWTMLLIHQFHDIIPGSSIGDVNIEATESYQNCLQNLSLLRYNTLKEIVKSEDRCFTLINTTSFTQDGMVLLPVSKDGIFKSSTGEELNAEITDEGWIVKHTMSPLSMDTITFEERTVSKASSNIFSFSQSNGVLQTPLFSISFNENGFIKSILDKKNNREILKAPGNILEIFEDKPEKFDCWDIDIYYMDKKENFIIKAAPELVENNSIRAVINTEYYYNKSILKQKLIVYSHTSRIDFVTEVDWNENDKLLKACFPLNLRSTKASYDIQFGHVERPTHWNTSWDLARFEVVGQKWADISEGNYGVSLINDCKYGYSVKDTNLSITLLKSSKYPDPNADMGKHNFTYSLYPHDGNVVTGDTIKESFLLNQPFDFVAGKLKEQFKHICKFSGAPVVVDAIKKADKEDCLVLRIHEINGNYGEFAVTSDYSISQYAECNLLEENVYEPIVATSIVDTISPFEIKTYKLWL